MALKYKDRAFLSLPKDWWELIEKIRIIEERESRLEVVRVALRPGLIARAEKYGLRLPADLAEARTVVAEAWGRPKEKR